MAIGRKLCYILVRVLSIPRLFVEELEDASSVRGELGDEGSF